ncbi:MAG: hypothetical protein M0P16_10965 [Syntrophales bacterium]|nr:hypothetical protein [Syntrophales bacterium]MCK9393007.1 hypothetical protein [Syntrophales bacterium]
MPGFPNLEIIKLTNSFYFLTKKSAVAQRSAGLAGYPLIFWVIRQLSAMPYCRYPYIIIPELIEKTIWTYDDFAKRKFRKLQQRSSRLRKLLEPGKRFLCFPTKSYSGRRLVSVNICNGLQELAATCGRE